MRLRHAGHVRIANAGLLLGRDRQDEWNFRPCSGEKIQPGVSSCPGETQDAKEAEITKRAIQVGHYARRHGLILQMRTKKRRKDAPEISEEEFLTSAKPSSPQISQTH